MQNIGGRPAAELVGELLIADQGLNAEPAFRTEFTIANEIPPGTPTPWYHDGFVCLARFPPSMWYWRSNIQTQLCRPNNEGVLHTVLCYEMSGTKDDQTHPDFVHASQQEKEGVSAHFPGMVE